MTSWSPATPGPSPLPPPIANPGVERAGDELVVTWEASGPVRVHIGESPDRPGRSAHELDATVVGTGEVRLRGLDPHARYVVHLVPVAPVPSGTGTGTGTGTGGGDADTRDTDTRDADGRALDHGEGSHAGAAAGVVVVAERLVPLEGTLNFRDLGGYRGLDGRTVRWGRVFRSDHLGQLAEGDVLRLERLGVRVVVDFRGTHEHAMTPSRLPPDGGIRRLDRPIVDGPAEGVTFYDRVYAGQLRQFDVDDLTAFYLATLERAAPTFGEVLGLVADPAQHAVVFHCTAGKDRTGLAAALVLAALGVADEDILDDYELTNRYRSGRRVEVLRPELAAQGIDIDRFLPLFVARREVLAATLVELRRRYGAVEGYLRNRGGVDADTLGALRAHLLEPAR